MPENVVEQIAVDVTARTAGFMQDVNRVVDRGTRVLGDGFDNAERRGRGLGGVVSGLVGGVSKLGFAAFGVQQLAGTVAGLAKSFLGGNIQFEGFKTSFEVLLGSADAAQKRIDELSKFAAETPFELPDVVQASKLLQTFGGDALATGDSLRMVGDMASTAQVGFSEVATWVGRAYTSIKAGRPFGEASQRLQELGLMSGVARQKLEDLQKSGASGEEVWAAFQQEMAGFGGMMDKQSKTWSGLTSTLMDNFSLIKRNLFAGVFEALKGPLESLTKLMGSPALAEGARIFGEKLGGGIATLWEQVQKVIPVAEDFFSVLGTGIRTTVGGIDLLEEGFTENLDALNRLPQPLQQVVTHLSRLVGLAIRWAPVMVKVGKEVGKRLWKDFAATLKIVGEVLGIIWSLIRPLVDELFQLNATGEKTEETVNRIATAVVLLLEAWLAFLAVKKVVQLTQNIVQTGAKLLDIGKDVTQKVTQFFTPPQGELPIPCDDCEKEIKQDVQKPTGAPLEKDETVTKTITQEVTPAPDDKKAEDAGKAAAKPFIKGMVTGLITGLGIALGTAIGAVVFTSGGAIAAAAIAAAAIFIAVLVGEFLLATEVFGHSVKQAIIEMVVGGGIGALLGGPVGALVGSLVAILIAEFGDEIGKFAAEAAGFLLGALAGVLVGVPVLFARLWLMVIEVTWPFFAIELPVLIGKAIAALPFIIATEGPGFILALAKLFGEIWLKANEFFFVTLPTLIGKGILNLAPTIANNGPGFVQSLPGLFVLILADASEFFFVTLPTEVVNGIVYLGEQIMAGLNAALGLLPDELIRLFREGFEKGWNWVKAFWEIGSPSQKMFRLGVDIIVGLFNGITSQISNLVGLFLGLPQQLLSAFKLTDPVTGFFNIGKAIVEGLWNGIKSMKNWILDNIGDLGQSIIDEAKDGFGLFSPSRVFLEMGLGVAAGLGLGIQQGTAGVVDRMRRLTETLKTGSDRLLGNRPLGGKTSAPDASVIREIMAHIRRGATTAVDALKLLRMGLPDIAEAVQKGIVGLLPTDRVLAMFNRWLGSDPFRPPTTAMGNMSPAMAPVAEGYGFSARSLTNYGRITNVYGPGRKSIDVIRDLDRMV